MAKILLHAGTHKTGTTTLQSALSAHRADLAGRGICYPDICDFFPVDPARQHANAHFALANAVADFRPEDRARLADFTASLREAAERFDHVVLSAESLYRHVVKQAPEAPGADPRDAQRRLRRRYVKRLARVFGGFDTEVVLYFRRVDRFAESLYAETVVTTDAAPDFAGFLAGEPFRFDYRFQTGLFARHFPLRTFGFEAAAQAGLVASFFRDNGLGAAPPEEPPLRASVPPHAVLWIRRAKAEAPGGSARRRRWLFALQPEAAELFRAGTPASFWPDTATRDAFLAREESTLPGIAFPPPAPEAAPPCVWTDGMHAAAERAFLAWKQKNRDWIRAREAARKQPFMP